MATSVEFDAAARAEFDEAFNWYAERSPGAALGFATEVDVAIESIAADPDRFQRTYAKCQLYRLKRYPYCVVYYRVGFALRVVAIAHAKRRPGYWLDRL
jgi:plasmid stabilization system protein ParE